MADLRSFVLFFIVVLVILTGWDFFFEAPKREAELQRIEQEVQDKGYVNTDLKVVNDFVSREESLVETKDSRISINTKSLQGSISLVGANIDDLILKGYKQFNREDSPAVTLLSPSNTKEVYFSRFGWLDTSNQVRVPKKDTVWSADSSSLEINKPVTLSWDNREGQIFYITFTVDENYMFDVKQSVVNNSDKDIALRPYGMISRSWNTQSQEFLILHEGALGTMDGNLSEVTFSDLKDDVRKTYKDSQGWFGLTNKYWLTAIIPDKRLGFKTEFKHNIIDNMDRYQVDFLGDNIAVSAGESLDFNHNLFTGAKRIKVLDKYSEKYGIVLFDRAIDFGVLYVITKPIFIVLQFLNDWLHNFGLAILGLTVLVKLLMFPLANKSYKSFAQMKKFAPDIQRIKEDYKDDRQAQSREMMALYREKGVNPMAGCLPVLIQMPVFFALYKVLFVTIEMRHAPFYGWIKDLSAQDPTTIFNLFGLLPWGVPSFLMIGILPILMSVTMVIQQKLNPPPSDPVQAKVMAFLPWIFLFIFAGFPAGLVLYWVWNNILSIIQQWTITRVIMKEK